MEPTRSDTSFRNEARRGIDRVDGSLRILFGARNLPVLPDSVARLAHMSDDPRVGPMAFLETLLADHGLSREVLNAVNRSWFSPVRPVGRVREAVTVLGTRQARYVALVAGIGSRMLPHGKEPKGFDRAAFWRHSVATGFAAERLARALGESLPETAFVAGLLHDVGLLILDRNDPAALEGVIERMAEGEPQEEVERDVVGATHVEIGRTAGRVWGLPPLVTDAVTHHHDPEVLEGHAFRVAVLVRVADWLATEDPASAWSAEELDGTDEVLARLGIDSARLEVARRGMVAALDDFEGLLKVGGRPVSEPVLAAGTGDGEVV